MKIMIYALREDERAIVARQLDNAPAGVDTTQAVLTLETARELQGYEAVCITTPCKITGEVAEELGRRGVKYVLARSAGYDHIDLAALAAQGIRAANVPVYSISAVPEFTVLLVLSLLRGLRSCVEKTARRDFTLGGVPGIELSTQTVGVIGTGQIGRETIRLLAGFGCRLLAFSPTQYEEVKGAARYCSLQELYGQSDIILYHCPVNADTRHMVDDAAIMQMKRGVMLVNTSRGELFDFPAILRGLMNGRVGALATDVYEGEVRFFRQDHAGRPLEDPVLEALLSLPQVLLTPHMAFFTRQSVENLMAKSMKNLRDFLETGACPHELFAGKKENRG